MAPLSEVRPSFLVGLSFHLWEVLGEENQSIDCTAASQAIEDVPATFVRFDFQSQFLKKPISSALELITVTS